MTDVASRFGLLGAIAAGNTNSAWQFVGSFAINIYPSEDQSELIFEIKNKSSATSFFAGIAPNWERGTPSFIPTPVPGGVLIGPIYTMGNMRQVYTWREPLKLF